jgi:hypothetical protein
MASWTSRDVYLLPVCTGWRGRSGDLTMGLAGLLVVSRTHEAEYVRIGIFGMDHRQACILYGGHCSDAAALACRLKDAAQTTIDLV